MNPTKRMMILAVLTAAGFSTVFLLPKAPPMRDTRLARQLPTTFGEWRGESVGVSGKELDVLAKDTTFERKSYLQRYDSSALPVEVSIVFSGKDLNNSLHRPETCLAAQGWSFVRMGHLILPGAAAGEPLPVKEILCKKIRKDANGEAVKAPNGEDLEDWQLLYYTFVGHSTITSERYSLTFADIRDRVVGGYDQTWAYATFSARIMGKYEEQGVDFQGLDAMDIDETGQYLAKFISSLTPKVLSPPPNTASGMVAAPR